MPMNPALLQTTMTASIQLQLQTFFPESLADPIAAANQIKLAGALAAAISLDVVTHIQLFALVNTVTAGTVSGITASGPPGGPLPIVAQPSVGTGTGIVL